jgi:hypothetical protein
MCWVVCTLAFLGASAVLCGRFLGSASDGLLAVRTKLLQTRRSHLLTFRVGVFALERS